MPNVYHDRKMLKWLPFEALETQKEAIRGLYAARNRQARPSLSDDQLHLMQCHVETSFFQKKEILITLYDDVKGNTRTRSGVVTDYDANAKRLYLDHVPIAAKDVINIESL